MKKMKKKDEWLDDGSLIKITIKKLGEEPDQLVGRTAAKYQWNKEKRAK